MKELLEKLKKIEEETSAEKGNYDLFALFLREESPGKWDILVAASWIKGNNEATLKYLAPKIQHSFTQNELLQISRIVIIEENNPELPALQEAINIEHGISEIKDATFFGLQIKRAIFITSRSRQAAW
jgi:hypothetical protein